jgi:broad specificity phosphatase PhoE
MFGERTTYFFVRHGQDGRRELDTMGDHPLTELGRRQSSDISERFACDSTKNRFG